VIAALRANLLATVLGALSAILLAVCLYQNVQIHGFLWIDGLNDKLENCARDRNELRAITSKKNEQKAETEKRVEQADKGNKKADERAKQIETAPLAPDCKTPDIIMESNDL